MRLLVAIKPIPDPAVLVRLRLDGDGVDLDGVSVVMNPFDEVALEAALRLRESGSGEVSDILAVSVAPSLEGEAILRTALAMGADRALLIEANSVSLEPLLVARVLQRVCVEQQPDLVLMGNQAPDVDNCQTGPMLAALLGWRQATAVSAMGELLPPPAVITTDLTLNRPRYASLPNIMRTRRLPVAREDIAALGIDLTAYTAVVGYRQPPPRVSLGRRVHDAAELAEALIAHQVLS
ncbi:MAG: electron transfer flavoprotein subunit beta/FixA family protein [Magnetococcales bacterium]|nr:electron transfer flavoprotein subunit beta/FixA family protein [Magnetococcales bacterium]